MGERFIHRFPRLAKLRPILRTIEIIDMVISFYERLPMLVKLVSGLMLSTLVAWLIQLKFVVMAWLEPNWRGFLAVLIPVLILVALIFIRDFRRNRPLKPMENTINKFGYSLVICNTEENPKTEEAYLNVMLEQRVDGLIITPTWNICSSLKEFAARNIPIVVVDRRATDILSDTVCVDNVHGAYTAVEHLILLGHKRIGLIGGPKMISTTQERVQGYLEALRKYDLKKDKSLLVDGGSSIEGGMKAMEDLLELPAPPTAVFGYNNVVTLGALLTLKQRNKKIPKDIAILGFDEVEWAGVVEPPLTVVSQPVYAIGATAGQLIMQRLLNEGPKNKQKIVLKTELVIRKSCGFKA